MPQTTSNLTPARIASSVRIPELDGLRAFAILQVVAVHHLGWRRAPHDHILGAVISASRLGWSGVDLFFVLSGFLISGIILDNRESHNLFSTFYFRRAFRILPMYALLLSAALVLGWTMLHPLWVYLTFTQNVAFAGGVTDKYLDVTWSLAIEEQMYLILPVTIYFASRKALVIGAFALLALTPAARFLCSSLNPWVSALTPLRMDSFAVGLLIAFAWRDSSAWSWITSKRVILIPALAIFLAGAVIAERDNARWAAYSLFAIGYGAALLLTLLYRPGFLRGPLAVIGVSAYSIYLFHEPIIDASSKIFRHGFVEIVLPIGCALGAGVVSHFLIERRFISFAASRWKYRRSAL